uniref:Trimeric intracellular cation channel type B n=1 Tax=Rodentolepis nana TaxID=102285 RepID=A0A0R3TGT1_RODNA
LDQFHIALSLLLGTLGSLFIPHVPEDLDVLCAAVAVIVNYFPLCAFAWKFVFGLNALLMVGHLGSIDSFKTRSFMKRRRDGGVRKKIMVNDEFSQPSLSKKI